MNTNQFTARTKTTLQNHSASIRNLEQVGQITNLLTSRPQGSLPSNTETNPKESVQAIAVQCGKELSEPVRNVTPPKEPAEELEADKQVEVAKEDVEKPKSKLFPDNPPPYVSPVPFPQRLQK